MSRVLQRVVTYSDRVSLHVSPLGLMCWLSDDDSGAASLPFPETWKLDVPCKLIRRGEQLRISIESAEPGSRPDRYLVTLLQRANRWPDRAEVDEVSTQTLAKDYGVTPSYFARISRLAYLAPDIVEAIVDGKQPVSLTARKLAKGTDLPIKWPAQCRRLGFPPA